MTTRTTTTALKGRAALLKSALCLTTVKPRPSPTLFYFPGLTSKPYHDRTQIEWCTLLEKNHAEIKSEYLRFHALEKSDYTMSEKEHRLHQGEWNWHSFVSQGRIQDNFMQKCPKTTSILQQIPSLMLHVPFAYAFFSTLAPQVRRKHDARNLDTYPPKPNVVVVQQSHIKAHSAPCNIRLRCHFPLIVPEGCGIRVGDETRAWEEGKCLVFDDSYDHEVWHDGKEGDRVVLLFDVWHPDLELGERRAIQDMFHLAKEKGWLTNDEEATTTTTA